MSRSGQTTEFSIGCLPFMLFIFLFLVLCGMIRWAWGFAWF